MGSCIVPKYTRWWIVCSHTILQSYSLFSRGRSVLWLILWKSSYYSGANPKQAELSISCATISRYETNVATPIQTSAKEARAYIADSNIKSVPQTQSNIRISIKVPPDVKLWPGRAYQGFVPCFQLSYHASSPQKTRVRLFYLEDQILKEARRSFVPSQISLWCRKKSLSWLHRQALVFLQKSQYHNACT